MRDSIWRDWSLSLFNDDRDTFGIGTWGGSNLGFPKLEKLTLDFSEWQLGDTDGLLVRLLPLTETVDEHSYRLGSALCQTFETKRWSSCRHIQHDYLFGV